ncbi:hypothetical protein Ddc_22298 [Ditylenchus destructor]|nr:hypothetical protein Ddc_22298 [Ditylenchus destructor]
MRSPKTCVAQLRVSLTNDIRAGIANSACAYLPLALSIVNPQISMVSLLLHPDLLWPSWCHNGAMITTVITPVAPNGDHVHALWWYLTGTERHGALFVDIGIDESSVRILYLNGRRGRRVRGAIAGRHSDRL